MRLAQRCRSWRSLRKALREAAGGTAAPSHDSLVKRERRGLFEAAWKSLLDDLNVTGSLGQVFGVLKKTKTRRLPRRRSQGARGRACTSFWMRWVWNFRRCRRMRRAMCRKKFVRWPSNAGMPNKPRTGPRPMRCAKPIELEGWVVKDRKDGWDLVRQA